MSLLTPQEVILNDRVGSWSGYAKLDSRRVGATLPAGRVNANIPIGRFVSRAPGSDLEVVLPTSLAGSVANKIFGCVPYTPYREETGGQGDYLGGNQMPTLRVGEIRVECLTPCVAGDPVFVRAGDAISGDDGKVQNTAGAGATLAVQIAAVFDQTLAAAGTVRVKVNLP